MLILKNDTVKHCYVLSQVAQQSKILPGINYQGHLFFLVKSLNSNQFNEALQLCRQLLDDRLQFLSVIVENNTGYSVWHQNHDLKEIELEQIIFSINHAKSSLIKDRRHKLQVIKQSLVGKELVDLLTKIFPLSRTEATAIGQILIERNFLEPARKEAKFQDDNKSFYCFKEQ